MAMAQNFIPFQENGLQGLKDAKGEIILKAQFPKIASYSLEHGIVTYFDSAGNVGIYNETQSLQVLSPSHPYKYITPLFRDGFVMRGTIFRIVNAEGKMAFFDAAEGKFQSGFDFINFAQSLNDTLVIFKGSETKKGLFNVKRGQLVLSSEYDEIGYIYEDVWHNSYLFNKSINVLRGKKWAIFDLKTKTFLTDFVFDKIYEPLGSSIRVLQGDKMGLYNVKRKAYSLPPVFKNIEAIVWDNDGTQEVSAYLKLQKIGKYAIYDYTKNVYLTDFLFNEIRCSFPDKKIEVIKEDLHSLYDLNLKKYLHKNVGYRFVYVSDDTYILGQQSYNFEREGKDSLYNFKEKRTLLANKNTMHRVRNTFNLINTEYIIYGKTRKHIYHVPTRKEIIFPEEYEEIYAYHTFPNPDDLTNYVLYFSCRKNLRSPSKWYTSNGQAVSKEVLGMTSFQKMIKDANLHEAMFEIR